MLKYKGSEMSKCDAWSGGLVGLMDDSVSCCVHLLTMNVPVCVHVGIVCCFPSSDSPIQCRVVYNVSNSLCKLILTRICSPLELSL